MSLMQRIGSMAIKSFKRNTENPAGLSLSVLEKLKLLINTLTKSDLQIDANLLTDRGLYMQNKDIAPVTYMQIYEDADLTISVFILKNGVTMPLHDHPNMSGILKVIHGKISVQRYSVINKNGMSTFDKKSYGSIHQATKHPYTIVDSSDPLCLVLPDSENLHEITSVDGPAAFLDILTPPYGRDKRTGEERECHYFEEIKFEFGEFKENSDNIVWLNHIPSPTLFWCDQTVYQGPPVRDIPS